VSAAAQDDPDTDCIKPVSTEYVKTPLLKGVIEDGYFSNTEGQIWQVPTNGETGLCIVGQYCQGGVSYDCGEGKFCHDVKLTVDGNDCDYGFYCLGGATNRRPTNVADQKGDRCPQGKFCVAGTGITEGEECPVGTYSSAYGLREQAECITCPNGF